MTLSCGAIAVLCSGCMYGAFMKKVQCDATKDQFDWSQDLLSKGEVAFGLKTNQTEAEIKETLESNLEHYSDFWKEYNCSGSLTDPS